MDRAKATLTTSPALFRRLCLRAWPARGQAVLPSEFSRSLAISRLTHPPPVRFAPDDRLFVAEKRGAVRVFSGISNPSPTALLDLSANVDDYWDRGGSLAQGLTRRFLGDGPSTSSARSRHRPYREPRLPGDRSPQRPGRPRRIDGRDIGEDSLCIDRPA